MAAKARPGFALVAVLWMVAAIALLTAVVVSRTGLDLDRSRFAVASARVRAAADGAAEDAVFRVAARAQAGGLMGGIADLADMVVTIGGIPVRVAVVDEDSRIDLNGAPVDLLAALFTTVGLTDKEAGILADRIADFRDGDGLRHAQGAEDPDYDAASLPVGAKDAPFDTVGELRQIPGMTEAILARVAPLVTVHSGRAQFDPGAAPPGLAELMAGIDARNLNRNLAPARRRVFSVTARAELPDGVRFTREAVFRLSGDPAQPIRWLTWTEAGS
jgi:general secretion pathway protein K